MNEIHPKFAVVGHPNKGKSSIVSTLAFDDSVYISSIPGSTQKKQSFPLKVDGNILYELFDTPGFQRARRVLAWLQKHNVSADKRADVVRNFIEIHRDDERFNDEVELLEPIMAGAGIIYVVDASKPYSEEYEAQMEVLRWTGQPSMALINHISESDYSQEWKRALGHYFKMVRTFNPMKATFRQHLLLLESIAQMKEEWVAPVGESIKLFKQYHEQMFERSARNITQLLYKSLSYKEQLSIAQEDAIQEERESIALNYQMHLRSLEETSQKEIKKIWNHQHLQTDQALLRFKGTDLFSKESASIFGLTRKELLITAATGGAMTGAGIDIILGGSTLLLGSAIGALVGGTGAFFGFNELSEVKVLGQNLGKHYLEMGPMENKNFPYILLGRAIYHATTVANRSHALREVATFSMDSTFKEKWLNEALRKSLEQQHNAFRSGKEIEPKELAKYEVLIREVLNHLVVK